MTELLERPTEAEPLVIGRQSPFQLEYIEQAAKLAKKGWTDKEMAEFFDVHVVTLYRWKKYSPAFAEAIEAGKIQANKRVEDSLQRLAEGFERDEEKVFYNSTTDRVVRVPTRKYYPPNARAIQYFLNNRDPENWRTKQEFTGPGGVPLGGGDGGAPRPRRTTREIARRTIYLLQRAQDEAQQTKVVEERITQTVEE